MINYWDDILFFGYCIDIVSNLYLDIREMLINLISTKAFEQILLLILTANIITLEVIHQLIEIS